MAVARPKGAALLDAPEPLHARLESDLPDLGAEGLSTRNAASALVESAPAIRVVDQIIRLAAAERASDVHIEAQQAGVYVRFRVAASCTTVCGSP